MLRSPSFPGRMADLCCMTVLQQGGTVCAEPAVLGHSRARPARRVGVRVVRLPRAPHGTRDHAASHGTDAPSSHTLRLRGCSLSYPLRMPLRRTRSKLSRSASVDASHAMQMMGVLLSTLIHRCWRTISECIIDENPFVPCLVPAVQSLSTIGLSTQSWARLQPAGGGVGSARHACQGSGLG